MNSNEDGVAQAVVERFVKQRLPEVLKLEHKVLEGEALNNGEIDILERLVHETRDFGEFLFRYPEYEELVAKISRMYEKISRKALDIEREDIDQG